MKEERDPQNKIDNLRHMKTFFSFFKTFSRLLFVCRKFFVLVLEDWNEAQTEGDAVEKIITIVLEEFFGRGGGH